MRGITNPIPLASSRVLIFIYLIVFSVGLSRGQEPDTVSPSAVGLDDLRRQGYEALYNLDYEGARRKFQEMVRLFPEHPAGPQSMAASLWLEELNRSRRLGATLYSAESLQQGTGNVPDPKTVEQFFEWNRKAKQLSETRFRRNNRDTEALYFLGAAEALKAGFVASIQRRYLAASRDASSAVDRHREVLKLDPNYHDAGLSIGLYAYVLGSLPLPVRLLATIGGMRGSKKRGLETLERVAREGHWAKDMARVLLIDLYKREKRWNEALVVSRDLSSRYPGNYTFQLQTADTLIRRSLASNKPKGGLPEVVTDDAREAFEIFDSLIRSRKPRSASALDVIQFRYGETLLIARRPQDAAKQFLAAAQTADSDPRLTSLARLRGAQSLDLAGKRREALVEYQAVLKGPNNANLHEQARRGLREPYKNEK
jgi:tetratricopeptide (TPR) repeat protein